MHTVVVIISDKMADTINGKGNDVKCFFNIRIFMGLVSALLPLL